jgi:hypothetical protein
MMRARTLRAVDQSDSPASVTRGQVVGWEGQRGIAVELASGRVALAQTTVALTAEQIRSAVAQRQAVLLTFEEGDPEQPVILGLLAPLPVDAPPDAAATPPGEDFVVIKGREAIELRCGAASITLRRDGKVVIRGTTLISRATEENRISGASLHFN